MFRAAPLPSHLRPYELDDLETPVVPVAIESHIDDEIEIGLRG